MGYTCLCLNHLDTIGMIAKKLGRVDVLISPTEFVLFDEGWDTTGCKTYESLPKPARDFIELIENITDIPVKYIGVGADNADTIIKS